MLVKSMTSAIEDLGFKVRELYVTPIDRFEVKYLKILMQMQIFFRIKNKCHLNIFFVQFICAQNILLYIPLKKSVKKSMLFLSSVFKKTIITCSWLDCCFEHRLLNRKKGIMNKLLFLLIKLIQSVMQDK